MKKIIKILLAVCAPLWLAFSCAHAEDIEIVSYTDTLSFDSTLNVGQGSYNLVSDTMASLDSVSSNWYGGSSLHSGYRISYLYPVSDTISGYAEYMNQYYSYSISNGSDRPLPASLILNSGSIVLDTTGFSSGAYHYSSEIYVGIGYHRVQHQINTSFYVPATFSLDNPSLSNNFFTYSYVGKEQVTYYTNGGGASVDLLHFHFDCYFELDGTETSKSFSLDTICDFILGSPISYDFSTEGPFGSRSNRTFYYLSNNRFESDLWKVDSMPAPPSPTPTPSPNQDVINNNNQNTTNIISSINNGFDALAAAFEGTIYGLTDLFFGDLTDWLDFFSDVEDDFEDNLPVVEFFSIVRNIFANFFPEVSSTDPSSLQFVAGWQSDIYVLHVPALSLVLPEGTFPFFPDVNFDLNNEFMNLIRPYWLTFCNLLVTLLWFRYLLHYLFRWSQLLTGNTAAAFELFMHQPEELDQLAGIGEDPYDLASDYKYDEIDSEYHDDYQFVEQHYGHGSARWYSDWLHGRVKD